MTKCQSNSILVTSATEIELTHIAKIADFQSCVTGIGILNTLLNVEQAITKFNPKIIIQLGICGAINKDLQLGEVVSIVRDFIGDLGAWRSETNQFRSFKTPIYHTDFKTGLKEVAGITVNMACNPNIDRSCADIESMEGAAFFAIAQKHNVKAVQIRAVSNYLDTPRDQWQTKLALDNLARSVGILQKKCIFDH